MESAPECPWGTTGTRRPRLGHLRPGSDMTNSKILHSRVHPPRLAQSPTRLYHGIPASTGRNATLHAITPGLQAKWNDKKDPRSQIYTQCVWPETSGQGLEQIYGPRHAQNRLYAEQILPMSLLLRVHGIPGEYRRLHRVWP